VSLFGSGHVDRPSNANAGLWWLLVSEIKGKAGEARTGELGTRWKDGACWLRFRGGLGAAVGRERLLSTEKMQLSGDQKYVRKRDSYGDFSP